VSHLPLTELVLNIWGERSGQGSIYWKIPSPLRRGNISRCHLEDQYEKGKRKRGEMQKKKEERGKKKGRKGKQKEKRGSKRIIINAK
jgi:hypothetical protein